ncbi:Alkene reductase [Candidatus Bealeia paramacronuclearis]|uniref:Alkene reductase n=1 Tax=Candidatus Bealeia paramacronuclearis TaxID=1921001 RepID=A0ABZ2C467_9PROT|nr:Alkene reductase [Candidatus Bealeia paramacronuclearis]
MGRVSHPDFLNGELPVGPSAIAAEGETHTPQGKKNYVTPRALTIPEIHKIIEHYAEASERAITAGFDGVEIHGANGYLIDQFIRDGSNLRQDDYGGTLENRLRFLCEVTKAVCDKIGSDRVGVRLSPTSHYNSMNDSDPVGTFVRAAELLNDLNICYLHTLEALPGHMLATEGSRVTPHIRKVFKNVLITNGGYNLETGNKAINEGEGDAIAFGVPFLANSDLIYRFKHNAPLNAPDFATLYTSGIEGYTDYPIIGI